MKKLNRKRKRRIIIYILFIILVLLVVFAVRMVRRLTSPGVDTSAGIEYMKNAEADDITSIEQKISQLESQENSGEDTRNAKDKFAGTVVMGDSVTAGFTDYDVLNASSVVSRIGAPLDDLDEQVEQVKGLAPRIIFLALGRDDILAGDDDTETFVEKYTSLVETLKKEVPDAHIFVNSLFPALDSADSSASAIQNLSSYNEALEQICDRQQIGFIDETGILDEKYYEEDGVHFTEEFYSVWADYMAEVAAL